MRRRVIIHAALAMLTVGGLALGWAGDAAAQRKFSFAYDQPTTTANASSVAPQAGVFSLHFIFRDEAHLTRALADKQVRTHFAP